MATTPSVLAIVLAGGHGTRLHPLTKMRSKPAVPFGARYRIIDFVLSNLVNSGLYSIYVLTQFRAQSLTEHVNACWRFGPFPPDQFITLVPAQMYRFEELGSAWYRGTADAVYQSLTFVDSRDPDILAIFAGDHILKVNVRHMIRYHKARESELTLAAMPVPVEDATRFGVLSVDDDWRLTDWEEKPAKPKEIPGRPGWALASMGNYLFDTKCLHELLLHDAELDGSSHDFGRDVIPLAMEQKRRIQVYNFFRNPIPGAEGDNTYWRDIGTLDAYYEANMDLVDVVPDFDVFNRGWPLRGPDLQSCPAKFVHESGRRVGRAVNSLVGGGAIVSGGLVRESILFTGVRVNSYALVENSIIFDDVQIGRKARVKKAIIDKGIRVPDGTQIGYDVEADRARGFTISDGGVVVVPKGFKF